MGYMPALPTPVFGRKADKITLYSALPIAEALYLAHVPVGTILALMMSVTTLSMPSLIMLSKVLTKRLLFTFIGIVVAGIIFIGYAFNFLWR